MWLKDIVRKLMPPTEETYERPPECPSGGGHRWLDGSTHGKQRRVCLDCGLREGYEDGD